MGIFARKICKKYNTEDMKNNIPTKIYRISEEYPSKNLYRYCVEKMGRESKKYKNKSIILEMGTQPDWKLGFIFWHCPLNILLTAASRP